MHPVDKGDFSVAKLTVTFLKHSFIVLKPISDRYRFDLVIDRGQGFERVQCKTGKLKRGAVCFNSCSTDRKAKNGRRFYTGEIELFGVYCPDNDKRYLIPIKDFVNSSLKLRVEPTKNKQVKKITFAEKYELK